MNLELTPTPRPDLTSAPSAILHAELHRALLEATALLEREVVDATPTATGTATIAAAGWNKIALASSVPIASGTTFVAAYKIANGDYYSNTSQSYPLTPAGMSLTAPASSCRGSAGAAFTLPGASIYAQGTFFADVEFVPA